MKDLDYWRLCDELSVTRAALLVSGVDPVTIEDYIEMMEFHERPRGYEAAKAAISSALRANSIEGQFIPHYEYDTDGKQTKEIPGSINFEMSTVNVASLKTWLSLRGIRTGFFFPEGTERPDYLDPNHPRYAPKLAAAVNAWLANDESNLIKGKSIKQSLDKWLREHAADYGLTDDDGNPINQAVEECSKVANWNPGGGAPKTPT